MTILEIAPIITLLGVLITLFVTIRNARETELNQRQTALLLESTKVNSQLRMAAIDRRLQAHQEAFALWRKLIGSIPTGDTHQAVLECQTWWEENCLYLEPEVRQAFVESYTSANLHQVLVNTQTDSNSIGEVWRDLTRFPNIVFKAINLPPLTENEIEPLKQPK